MEKMRVRRVAVSPSWVVVAETLVLGPPAGRGRHRAAEQVARITDTADRMNSHSSARKSTLMIVSAISDTGDRPAGMDEHPGRPDLDP